MAPASRRPGGERPLDRRHRVVVLGHSILGILAIEAGRRRPDVVSHVVTAGTMRPRSSPTELVFTHVGFSGAEERTNHEHGWTGSLARLVEEVGRGPSSKG
jgi:pimeloyl-ACP methyl ester carboxylesterase